MKGTVAAPQKAMERIRRALVGGHPLIYVQSWEETRVERLAQHLAKTFYGAPVSYGVWSLVDGLSVDGQPVPNTHDPLAALEAILAGDGTRAEESMHRHVKGFEHEIRKVLVER